MDLYKNKSILHNSWNLINTDERKVLYISQKFKLSFFLSKVIVSNNIQEEEINDFLYPDINKNIPNPFKLKDMKKTIFRTIKAIDKNEKIGILADYDVDGSTSAAILYNFLKSFNLNISIKIPNRLVEGYGPNERIMDEFINEKVSLVYILDCGTTSFKTLNNSKYSSIDIVVIDHHISEIKFPSIFSLINPNRYDENSEFKDLAAVGVTFMFLMGLRKSLRENKYFESRNEPNLMNSLDMVALGTVCDVVNLNKINRNFVYKGLEIIKLRKSKIFTSIFDNLNLKSAPKSSDLGFIIGPQLNAASRLNYFDLPTKILISKNVDEIESIGKKLILLNEKRKLIENHIYNQAIQKIDINKNKKFILIHGNNWHRGVLGIVASRIQNEFYKPTIVISFENNIGFGSARSIKGINLGNMIMEAKANDLLFSGGGHSMAAGLRIDKENLSLFNDFLNNSFEKYEINYFEKKLYYVDKISMNQVTSSLIDDLKLLEPFGKNNEEPNFIFSDVKIESIKKIKDKHILVFFKNDFNNSIKGFCFNAVNTVIGDFIEKYNQFNFEIAGILKEDNYSVNDTPQIIIKDLIILN